MYPVGCPLWLHIDDDVTYFYAKTCVTDGTKVFVYEFMMEVQHTYVRTLLSFVIAATKTFHYEINNASERGIIHRLLLSVTNQALYVRN